MATVANLLARKKKLELQIQEAQRIYVSLDRRAANALQRHTRFRQRMEDLKVEIAQAKDEQKTV